MSEAGTPWIERADWPKCDWSYGPFDSDIEIEVRFNDGTVETQTAASTYWPDDGDECDIAAYRLLK